MFIYSNDFRSCLSNTAGGFDLHIISRCGENGEICWHSLEIHNSIAHTLASNNIHVYQL